MLYAKQIAFFWKTNFQYTITIISIGIIHFYGVRTLSNQNYPINCIKINSLTALNADYIQEKVSECIIYTIKLQIAPVWITVSFHPHFISTTKTVKMGKEKRKFKLSILKCPIYSWEILRDSSLTPPSNLPRSQKYSVTSRKQPEQHQVFLAATNRPECLSLHLWSSLTRKCVQ